MLVAPHRRNARVEHTTRAQERKAPRYRRRLTTGVEPPQAPRVDDAEGVRLLRRALDRAGFAGGLDRALGKRQAPPGPSDDLLGTLVRLLYLGASVNTEEAVRAFAPLELSRLEAMGVVRASGPVVEPLIELDVFAGTILAADPIRETHSRQDHVLRPTKATRLLAAVSPRDRVERALDLGTGQGAQALLLAEHADEVVATDLNARAVAFTAFNAVLNGLPNVVARAGSLFEPVAGERFDLVLSNPPYVISPDNTFTYRDSDLQADALSESVVGEAANHLTEGGLALVLVNWTLAPNEQWAGRVRAWVEGTGCDAVLLLRSLWNPLGYATEWNAWQEDDTRAYGAALDRWLEHFAAAGIERVGGGVVALRRRPGSNWFAAFEAPGAGPGSGEHLRRLIDAQDLLRGREADELLDERLVPANGLVVDLRHRAGEGSARTFVSIENGLGFRVEVAPAAAELLTRLDPDTRVSELVEPEAAGVVRQLVELGLIAPATG
jgi:methylase of polypeptide subunit release factors